MKTDDFLSRVWNESSHLGLLHASIVFSLSPLFLSSSFSSSNDDSYFVPYSPNSPVVHQELNAKRCWVSFTAEGSESTSEEVVYELLHDY